MKFTLGSNVDTTMSHTNQCLVCREDIRVGANKCVYCGSFQNWRRHFDVGSSVLTSLITLFSVMGLAIPAIVKVAYLDDSQINLAYRKLGGGTDDFKSKTVVYKIWNEGVRQGEIGDVTLELILAGSKHPLRMYETTGKKIFVDPGKVDIISFAILPQDIKSHKGVISAEFKGKTSMQCEHSVNLYGFRGNRVKTVKTMISPTECKELLESYLEGDS